MSSQIKFSDKASARVYFSEKRALINSEQRVLADASICATLAEHLADAKTVLLFSSIRGEPDLCELAKLLLVSGKTVAFPVSYKDTTTLEFRTVNTLDQLSLGAYGIREPRDTCKKLTNFENAVCLTPALAFDHRGFRLGYGKGYYDRFFAVTSVRRIGIAYGQFVVSELPHGENDIPVELIITEKGVIVPHEE